MTFTQKHIEGFRIASITFLLTIVSCSATASAQVVGKDITVDWSQRPTSGPVTAPSIKLSGPTEVTFHITNVNDILYNYKFRLTQQAKENDDAGLILSFLKQFSAESGGACTDQVKQIASRLTSLLTPEGYGSHDPTASIPLSDTETALKNEIQAFEGLTEGSPPACDTHNQEQENELNRLAQSIAQVKQSLASSHEAKFADTLDPDFDYLAEVDEYTKDGKPTTGGSMQIEVKPQSTVLTLSLGPLFSGIQNRTYTAQTVPDAAGTGTKTVLEVQGRSLSTAIVALLNYKIPYKRFEGDRFGVDWSAGPVFRFGSSGGTSSLGFFTGPSIHLYRRLFLTAGAHVGQFADFPLGFNAAGQTIPANFPTPQPVIRTVVRFAFAVTFQTKDFNFGGNTTVKPAQSPASPSSGGAGQSNKSNPQANATKPKASTNGPSSLEVSATSISFDTVAVGQQSNTQDLIIRNHGDSEVSLAPPTDYPHFKVVGCQAVAASDTCTAHVTFTPDAAKAYDEKLNIVDETGASLKTVEFKGTGKQ